MDCATMVTTPPVLATGGSGFIGRRIVRALLDDGAGVTVAGKRGFRTSGLATVWPEFSEAAK
jgi:NAD(P)-dependent dehydrogenase (short-subunit alcohol dehydrogenase family)